MSETELTVVYHVACMCNYAPLIEWQMRDLVRVGLSRALVTHVGPGLEFVRACAERCGLSIDVRFSDPNTDHYETPAMFLIEQLAGDQGAVLYLHTKGVTQPHSAFHARWRELMHVHTIGKWREHVARLDAKDLCGLDWIEQGHGAGHFSGNFWLARRDYLKRLPRYADFHRAENFTRFSCEQWIGRGVPPPRVHSEYVMNVPWNRLCLL